MCTSPKHLTVLALILAQLVVFIQGGVYDNEDHWVYTTKSMELPEGAVLGGIDSNGYYNYVGRVTYSSSVLPARVVPELGMASFNTDTLSNQASYFDVLVANETVSYEWIRSFDGFREKNAVSVGTYFNNDRVYICRARTDGGVIMGTLLMVNRMCYIKTDNMSMKKFDKYEILIRHRNENLFMPFDAKVKNY